MKKRTYIIMNICSVLMIIFTFSVIFLNVKDTYSSGSVSSDCSSDAVLQLAKIIYKEVGGETASNSELNFYRRITTGSVVLNNAFSKSGDTIYDKLYNLTDSNYEGYSSYKNSDFLTVTSGATSEQRGELLYISQLILANKYNLPKNIIYQATRSILESNDANVWDYTESISGLYDVYWGYNGQLSTVDVFGNTINDTSSTYYRNLSESLKKDSYSKFTVDNVCNVSLNDDYTVYFYYDETGNELYKKMTGNENVAVILPPNPEKEGYTFKHWKDDNGNIVSNSFNPSSDRNLYAVWEEIPKEYTVNFYYDETGNELYKKMTGNENVTVILPPNPEKEGYTFKHWEDDNGNIVTEPFNPNSDRNLYAVWEKELEKFIVTFYSDKEKKDVYKKVEVVEGNSVKLPTNPTKDGYEFKGWVTTNNNAFDVKTKITGNLDLFASWKLIEDIDKDDNIEVDDDNEKIDEDLEVNDDNSKDEDYNDVESPSKNQVIKEDEELENPKTGVLNIIWIFGTCMLTFALVLFYFKRIKSHNNF